MFTLTRFLALAAMLAFAAGMPARAEDCDGSEIYLEDHFDDNLTNWPEDGQHTVVRDGRYYVTPDIGSNSWRTKLGGWGFSDGEFCVDVRFEKNGGDYMGAGFLFWVEDWDNNFNALLFTDRDVWIRRENDAEYHTIKLIDQAAALDPSIGVDNRLMLRSEGNVLTVFVNGTQVFKARVQKPAGDTEFGFFVYGRDGENQASFDNVMFTSLD